MKYIHIHPLDNVVVALEDLKKGDLISATAKAPAEIQSSEAPAGLPSAQAPAGLQKAASVKGTSEPAKSAVSSPSSTAAGRSRSSRMACHSDTLVRELFSRFQLASVMKSHFYSTMDSAILFFPTSTESTVTSTTSPT